MENNLIVQKEKSINKYANLQKLDYKEFNTNCNEAIGIVYNEKDFKNTRFKSGRYNNCSFIKCTFEAAGLSGTHFSECKLIDFNIYDSNLQFCDFSQNTSLVNNTDKSKIISSNLSQSMFHKAEIKNVLFKSTTISQARVIDTLFDNVIWESCTLQDDIFDNVEMDNISLIGCNLEYSEFKNITIKNVKLPLHQLPYTYGLLQVLDIYENEILIGALSSNREPIKPAEYKKLLPELLAYYTDMREYFPAINISLYLNDYEHAKELINVGIKYYINTNDFRKLKAICKLISTNAFFDKHFLTQLYFRLVEYYNKITVSEYDRYQYSLHINDIKNILTGFCDDNPIAHLYLKTNITSSDTEKLGCFYQIIEQCLDDCHISTDEYSIEVRHNSPPLSFWITITQCNQNILIKAIGFLMAVVTADPSFLQNALSVLGNIATIGAFALQISDAYKMKENKEATSTYPDVADKDIKYVKENSNKLKSKKISVEISLPFFNFSYTSEKSQQNQN